MRSQSRACLGQCVTNIHIRICKNQHEYSSSHFDLPFFVNPNILVFLFAPFFSPNVFVFAFFCQPQYIHILIHKTNIEKKYNILYFFYYYKPSAINCMLLHIYDITCPFFLFFFECDNICIHISIVFAKNCCPENIFVFIFWPENCICHTLAKAVSISQEHIVEKSTLINVHSCTLTLHWKNVMH